MMSYEKFKRKGWINGTDVDRQKPTEFALVFSQIAVVSYSHSVEEPNPYIESSHDRWTPSPPCYATARIATTKYPLVAA